MLASHARLGRPLLASPALLVPFVLPVSRNSVIIIGRQDDTRPELRYQDAMVDLVIVCSQYRSQRIACFFGFSSFFVSQTSVERMEPPRLASVSCPWEFDHRNC